MLSSMKPSMTARHARVDVGAERGGVGERGEEPAVGAVGLGESAAGVER